MLAQAADKKNEKNSPGYLFLGLVALGVVLLDQITKWMVIGKIPLHDSITVIPGFFSLTHLYNPGGAFGIFAGNASAWRHWLFLAATVLAIGLILYFYRQTPKSHVLLRLALGFICGGALGNCIDRIRFGEVVDFLLFYIGRFSWPAFNVADSAVTVGVAIFIFHIAFKKMPY